MGTGPTVAPGFAATLALELLKTNPPPKLVRPPYPDYKQRLPGTTP